jgi:RNA polymerase sigma-70 factor (sigma-E family)
MDRTIDRQSRAVAILPRSDQMTPDITPETLPETPAVTFEQLYQAQRLPMVRLALLLVDDVAAAEDVVQDAFAALHTRWARLRDPHAATGYLRTSVLNASRSVLRRRRTARGYVPPAVGVGPGADDAVLLAAEHREVVAALARLAPRQREVLVLRYWSELSEAEIAATLGISRGAVKSTASRALDALESLLEEAR